MTNFEYHKSEIEKILLKNGNIKFAVVNDEIIDCNDTNKNCSDCMLNKTGDWSAKTKNCVEWRYCKLWKEGEDE